MDYLQGLFGVAGNNVCGVAVGAVGGRAAGLVGALRASDWLYGRGRYGVEFGTTDDFGTHVASSACFGAAGLFWCAG